MAWTDVRLATKAHDAPALRRVHLELLCSLRPSSNLGDDSSGRSPGCGRRYNSHVNSDRSVV